MEKQISIDDLLRKPEPKVVLPASKYDGEKVFTIPDDVFQNRCIHCKHKNAEKNVPVPLWAVHNPHYSSVIPCRILGVCRPNDRPGECMSFAPRIDCYGICETCKNNNIFHEGFCMKEDHAPQRRVFYGQTYGGDEKKIDYYGRHALSVCDDYDPDEFVRRAVK